MNIIKRQNHNIYKQLGIGEELTNLNIRVHFHKYVYNTTLQYVALGAANSLRGKLEDRMGCLMEALSYQPNINRFIDVKFVFRRRIHDYDR